MKDFIVLRIVAKFIIPFILLYAFYIQLHGDFSPGGGFQAGVILASAFILFCLIYGLEKSLEVISIDELITTACIGVFLYIGTGFATLIEGADFLDYNILHQNNITGQHIGIAIVELGVGITVFSSMLLIFYLLINRQGDKK